MPYLYSSSLHWRVETLARQNQDLIVCRSISDELSASSTHEFAIVSISSQTLVSAASPPHPTATWPKLSISQPCQLLSYRGCTVDDSVCSPIPAASPHLTATSGDPVISRDSFQLLSIQRRIWLHRVPSNAGSSITSEASPWVSSLLSHLYPLSCFAYSRISAYRRVM